MVYIIPPLTNQLRTSSRRVAIKYISPLVVYNVTDSHDYLLMTLDDNIFKGFFEHKKLNPAIIRTSQGNVQILPQLNYVIDIGIAV